MQQQSYQNAIKAHKKHWWWKSRKIIFSSLLRKYIPKRNIKILDFGSGVGSNLKMLSKFGKCDAFKLTMKLFIILKKI